MSLTMVSRVKRAKNSKDKSPCRRDRENQNSPIVQRWAAIRVEQPVRLYGGIVLSHQRHKKFGRPGQIQRKYDPAAELLNVHTSFSQVQGGPLLSYDVFCRHLCAIYFMLVIAGFDSGLLRCSCRI